MREDLEEQSDRSDDQAYLEDAPLPVHLGGPAEDLGRGKPRGVERGRDETDLNVLTPKSPRSMLGMSSAEPEKPTRESTWIEAPFKCSGNLEQALILCDLDSLTHGTDLTLGLGRFLVGLVVLLAQVDPLQVLVHLKPGLLGAVLGYRPLGRLSATGYVARLLFLYCVMGLCHEAGIPSRSF
jgi:hypothetical protein